MHLNVIPDKLSKYIYKSRQSDPNNIFPGNLIDLSPLDKTSVYI